VSKHPLWLVGFRPFFALACLSGLSLPVLWALMFAGVIEAPTAAFTAIQWHAHEMFFGFGWAMLGGFLLTASKNWVKIRGYHGARAGLPRRRLVLRSPRHGLRRRLAAGRCSFLQPAVPRRRRGDAAVDPAAPPRQRRLPPRQRLLPAPAAAVPAAKLLLLDGHWSQAGELMALGLFRLAFLIMLERTLTDFMKNVFKAEILRHPLLDVPIKSLALALAFAGFLPPPLQGGPGALLALLLHRALRLLAAGARLLRLDIGVMYLGYLAIVLPAPGGRLRAGWRRWSGSAASPSTCSPSAPWA
jgi:uncharacterized protein involved in response to NO